MGPASPLYFEFLYGVGHILCLTADIVHNITYAIVGVGGIGFWLRLSVL